MSSLPSSRPDAGTRQPLPAAWIDRLFARFTAFYGSQKVGTMWVDADMAEVKAVWAAQLARFEPASIADALQRLAESGNQWPPTLPEFVEMCRLSSVDRRQAHGIATALPEPGGTRTDVATAKRHIDALLAGLVRAKRMPVE